MPAVPRRDEIGFELAEKASKQHRDKKENALKLASRLARWVLTVKVFPHSCNSNLALYDACVL